MVDEQITRDDKKALFIKIAEVLELLTIDALIVT
jgi:hypothetical protein